MMPWLLIQLTSAEQLALGQTLSFDGEYVPLMELEGTYLSTITLDGELDGD
jgi:hypothetical protein